VDPDLLVNVAKSVVMNPVLPVGVLPKIAEAIPNVRMSVMSAMKDRSWGLAIPENVNMKKQF